MTDPRRRRAWRFGRLAELACVGALVLRGYRVIARNVKTPAGEIDIVARRGRTLAIIEVKARASPGDAAEALGSRQRGRLVRAAEAFRQAHPNVQGLAVRFDAMLVGPWRLPVHVRDAWRPNGV